MKNIIVHRAFTAKKTIFNLSNFKKSESVTGNKSVKTPFQFRLSIILSVLLMMFSISAWGATEVSVNIADYASAHSWTGSGGGPYTSVTIDANVTATVAGGGNTGKYYTDWRLYQSESATITITTTSGTLSSVTFTYSTSNGGVLKDGSTNVNTGAARSISGTSKTFSVGNTGTKTNGQVRITAISVTYTPAASCSNKVTISKGTESHGSFNLNKTGAQETCSGLTVTVTDISPSSGWQFDHIEQTGVAAGNVTIDNAAKTVTYAADVTGASSITAVFTEEVSETFDLVTDASDLSVGDEIIILEEDGDVAISTTQNTNNRGETSNFTLSGTTVTVPSSSNVEVFTLGASTHTDDHWTLHASGTEGYLYAANSSNNHLKTRASNDDGNSEWAISISSTIASIIAQGSYTRNVMQYNSGSSIFACYGSASQTGLKIYRKSTTDPTITAPSSLTGFTYNYGEGPDTKTMSVSGKNLTGNLTVELQDGEYELSLNNSTWSTSLTLTETAGVVSNTTIYVRLVSGLTAGTRDGSIVISGGGATAKEVTLSGSVTLVCSTPTLSFGGVTSLEKVLGSGKFTVKATASGTTLSDAIRYSSSNPSKATVDENSGEVTLLQATGSGAPVTITARIEAQETSVACQDEATASYTLTIYNQVTWMVGEDEYTGGSPTTQTAQGGQIATFPSNPDGDALCGGKVFKGWTDHEVVDPEDVAPTPLYTKLSDLSSVYITANTTFYAVFAASSGSGSTPTLTKMVKGNTFSDGDKIVIVAKYGDDDVALYQQTVNTNYVEKWTFDNDVETVAADNKKWLTVSTAATGTWYLGDATNGYLRNSGNNLYCDATKVAWTLLDREDGTFRLASDRYLSYRSDLSGSNQKWRMGGSSYGTSGSVELYIYKFTGSGTTLSDYATTCGTCLPAPTDPIVTPKSTRATITWDAVPDATGYTVTCSGGSVSVVGTTATITGLASETTYNFTIRSQGEDPYSCFPAYHGSFTTTSCEDSPIVDAITVTPTSATISWTCEAATSTIRIYTDYECTDQVGSDHTLCTSPYTITSLTSNTKYYYKILAGGTCASLVESFTTEELKLDIAEWQMDAVVVSYNGDADLTLTTLTEETHGDPHENVADDIFFSKYFEAARNVKLLGIFNGTMQNVNLADYELGLAQSSGAEKAFTFTKFSDFVKADDLGLDIGGLTEDELLLKSNEEIILITYANGDDDPIIACAKNDEEHSKYSTYIRISTPALQFNGDDVISLKDPSGNLIDIIGAGTKDEGSKHSGASFQKFTSGVDHNGFMDSPGGWYNANGYHALAGNSEASGYAISTNRCLLIRRKVKSGYAAVERNTEDFVTLGDYTYMGDSYEGEWKGVQIPGSTTQGSKPGLSNSCDGFAVLGGYNYNDYYVDFEISGTPTTFDDFKSVPFDGTYVIPVTNLYDKACTFVRIELKDGSDNMVIRKDVKVPIMISGNKNTTDDIFHSNYKDAEICQACDVVVLNGGTLTKVPDGTTGDISEVRDLKIYPSGRLVVPSGRNYTVNSLAFRRQEDEVASANIQGNITIKETNGVYLDLRIDPTYWHYFSLPYDCNVSDITFSTGDPATLGTDYMIKWYDGEKRAATQDGGCWAMVTPGATLKKGLGYVCALPGNGIIKLELRFPMSNTVIDEEKGDKMASPVYGYGCDKSMTEVRANHRGWNLLGNPYLLPYTTDITSPLETGLIVEDHSTDPWDGHYKFDEDSRTAELRYIVEPLGNGWSGYRQVSISNYPMLPFTCYFVQVGGTNPAAEQGVNFHLASVNRSSIVRRAPKEYEEEEDTHPVWCAVDITNTLGETDETTLLISNDFTDNYDMMNDLVKMRGSYYSHYSLPIIASRNNEGEMAFNALPDASAAAGVPLNYFAASTGEYTIAYNDKYGREEIKAVMLNDKQTGQWIDLMEDSYTFASNRVDNNDRFVLIVRVERKKTPENLTDIENLYNGTEEGPRKLLINGHVYIQRGGQLFDITGKQVKH